MNVRLNSISGIQHAFKDLEPLALLSVGKSMREASVGMRESSGLAEGGTRSTVNLRLVVEVLAKGNTRPGVPGTSGLDIYTHNSNLKQ